MNMDWRTFTKKSEWETYFKREIPKNNTLLFRSVKIIFDLQTDAEQSNDTVRETNGVGFTKADANAMSRIAKKIENKLPLNDWELERARRCMGKYWRQLAEHAIMLQNKKKEGNE